MALAYDYEDLCVIDIFGSIKSCLTLRKSGNVGKIRLI